MQPSTILQRNDVLNFPLPFSLSEGRTRTTLSVALKAFSMQDSSQSEKGQEPSPPFARGFQGSRLL